MLRRLKKPKCPTFSMGSSMYCQVYQRQARPYMIKSRLVDLIKTFSFVARLFYYFKYNFIKTYVDFFVYFI